jgi:transposase
VSNATTTTTTAIIGSAPGTSWNERIRLAALRAVRTLIQGAVAAVPTAGAGSAILSADYWQVFLLAFLGAVVTAVASFLQNIAAFLPTDPTQRPTG